MGLIISGNSVKETSSDYTEKIISPNGGVFRLIHGVEQFGGEDSCGVKIFLQSKELTREQVDELPTYEVSDMILKKLKWILAESNPEVHAARKRIINEFKEIFEKAGEKAIYTRVIKNEYCSDACCAHKPWLIVTTSIGHIKIGWRKRVINIDWTDTDQKNHGEVLFPDETSTKSRKYDEHRLIHAWSYEDAVKYIKVLHTADKEVKKDEAK